MIKILFLIPIDVIKKWLHTLPLLAVFSLMSRETILNQYGHEQKLKMALTSFHGGMLFKACRF